jgi:hypothetical protein
MEQVFSVYGVIIAGIAMGGVLVILGWIKPKIRVKQKDGDEFILGDDTPFEKTNRRFKDLCENSAGLKEAIGKLEAGLNSARLDVLKLQITNEQLPASYRLKAYDEYKTLGGNSWVDEYTNTYLKPEAADVMKHRLGGEK